LQFTRDVAAVAEHRSFGKMKPIRTLILLFSLTVAGCVSYQEHAAERTAQLREMYPPGMSREEVQGKWGKPDFSASRPTNGWDSDPNQYIAKKLKDVEASTGKKVESVDRYWGPDGWMSLCYCWYFYDSGGKIVDVEWQYKSD
jgi:hypothetical protein